MQKSHFQLILLVIILFTFSPLRVSAVTDAIKGGQMLKLLRDKPQKAVLNFKVNIFFGRESEIEENLDWGKFYLLDRSVLEILQKLNLNVTGENGTKISENELSAVNLEAAGQTLTALRRDVNLGNVSGYGSEDKPEYQEADSDILLAGYLLEEALQARSIKVFDLSKLHSSVRFAYRTGDFYIFGFGTFGTEFFVWEKALKLNPGENTFEFDQYNSEILVSQE